MARRFDKWLYAICFFVPLILDRITKYLIISEVWYSTQINSFFNVYVTYNSGVAWGFGSTLLHSNLFWLLLVIAIILFYFTWYMRLIAHNRYMVASCLLIISGGISNFFDRIWYGSVIDFIQLHTGSWYFPVFNVADISITLGAALLTYFVWVEDKK